MRFMNGKIQIGNGVEEREMKEENMDCDFKLKDFQYLSKI